MKALVKKSLVLVLVSLFVFSVSAQRPDRIPRMTPEDVAAKQTEMMTKQLDLTADQQAKIQAINLKYAQQMAAQRSQAGDDRQQMRENMKAQMEARDAEFKQVLTPEQFEKWQTVRDEMRQNRGQGAENNSEKSNETQTQN